MACPRKYPEELLDRGVRVVVESGRPIAHVARDLGVGPESLRKRVRQAEADSGKRSDLLSTQEREEIRKLRRENFELRRANEILKAASVFFGRPCMFRGWGECGRGVARPAVVCQAAPCWLMGCASRCRGLQRVCAA
jgi:transposase